MSRVELVSQPSGETVGDRLIQELEHGNFERLQFAVAFARKSGTIRLKRALEAFRAGGSTVESFIGIDLEGTSYEALEDLLEVSDKLYVVHAESAQTFHPKLYNFVGTKRSLVITGSNNLTGGGLWTNVEVAIANSLDLSDSSDSQTQSQVEQFFNELGNDPGTCRLIAGEQDLDLFLQHKYVPMERSIREKQVAANSHSVPRSGAPRLFTRTVGVSSRLVGSSSVASFLPKTVTPVINRQATSSPSSSISARAWFETRSMTGGSGNILDLSKTGTLFEGYPGYECGEGSQNTIPGGVTFFGVDPESTGSEVSIDIEYLGRIYKDNVIKYPVGDKSNGSWRLQIKGTDSGEEITQSFISRDYLKQKVLVFSQIASKTFRMEVFDKSELESVLDRSLVVAHNGSSKNSRMFGYF